MQSEINTHRAVRKMNAVIIGAIENARIDERMYVAMDRLYIATDAPSYLAKSHGILPRHHFKDFPPFFRQGLPKQIDGGKRYMGALLLSLESCPGAPASWQPASPRMAQRSGSQRISGCRCS